MDWCCGCCGKKKSTKGWRSINSAQNWTKTVRGRHINTKIHNKLHTIRELELMKLAYKQIDNNWTEIFTKPCNVFSRITDFLYLTGMGGISEENIRQNNIKCLINVTHELPKFTIEGIESIRIPVSLYMSLICYSSHDFVRTKVEDSYTEDLKIYFRDISNKIQSNESKKIKTVIYCIGGVSRSPSLVMAYLMRSKKMHLKKAFQSVITIRPVVHPNRNFLQSLVVFEKWIYKKNFQPMISIDDKSSKSASVPDFAVKYYISTKVTSTSTDSDPDLNDETIDMRLSAKFKELDLEKIIADLNL